MKPQIRLQLRARRDHPRLHKPPEGDQKLPCQRHDPNLSDPFAPRAEAALVPFRQLAPRLKSQPPPCKLDRAAANVPTSVLPDPLLSISLAAVLRRRCQPRQRAHFLGVAKGPPTEKLHALKPRRVDPDTPQRIQLHRLRDRRALRPCATHLLTQHATPLRLQIPDPWRGDSGGFRTDSTFRPYSDVDPKRTLNALSPSDQQRQSCDRSLRDLAG